jgi:hypothetical protein
VQVYLPFGRWSFNKEKIGMSGLFGDLLFDCRATTRVLKQYTKTWERHDLQEYVGLTEFDIPAVVAGIQDLGPYLNQ